MSDGGRDRASVGVEVWKSSQKWSVRPSAVRSIAWLDRGRGSIYALNKMSQEDDALTRRSLMLNSRHAANDDGGNDEADDTAERRPPPTHENGPKRANEEKQHDEQSPAK